MNDITKALARAGSGLLHPKMFLLMIWPLALSLALWITLAVIFGVQLFNGVEGYLNHSSIYQWVTSTWPLSLIAAGLLWLLMFLLAIPLVLVTATLLIGVLAMPIVVNHVAAKDYPSLERKQGGTIIGSVWNAVAALLWLVVLAIVSLPLWFIPILWPVIPVVLLGYVNQRVFRYDALAEHGSRDEMKRIIRTSRMPLLGLGMVLGLIGYIPILGFFSPVFSALAFTYYSFDKLAAMRQSSPAPVPS
ncbi:MAG: EI24 domain-containing protein [Burkholderiales bacterium]